MKKTLAIFIFLILTVTGCSSDSDQSGGNTISGQWKLTNVDGTFAGIHDNFPAGTIIWDFHPENQTVTITNNNTNPNLWDLFDSGTYPYRFVNNPDAPCAESIEIDGSVYGCLTISNNTLVIDQSIADGFAITLRR